MKLKKLIKPIHSLNKVIARRIDSFGEQSFAFGIFGILNYPLFYIIWHYFANQPYVNMRYRIIATALTLPLIFKKFWPITLRYWFPIYWYITLLYCIPFFFIFMMLENNGSDVWLMSSNVVIFWLVLLVDSLSYLFLLFLGITFALIFYLIISPEPFAHFPPWSGILAQYIASFIVILIFAYYKERSDKDKIEGMKLLSTSIAHELRTPINAIKNYSSSILEYLPILIEGNQQITKKKTTKLRKDELELLSNSIHDIDQETRYANLFIDMLLTNFTHQNLFNVTFEKCNLFVCVDDALKRYPLTKQDREIIQEINIDENFTFLGDKILTIHVIFNLLKNALHYVKAAGKGEITITSDTDGKYNYLYFTDMGMGIPASEVNKVFERFYSKTRHGSGVGLSFCKMVMKSYNGDIICDSVEGEYTKFTLRFPKIESKS